MARTMLKPSKGTKFAPSIDPTFPDRLKPLATKLYQQALAHPAFVLMSSSEIRQSIENRLWSLASRFPLWFGCGPATKREATEAQLAALAKARGAKEQLNEEEAVREQRISERVEAINRTSTLELNPNSKLIQSDSNLRPA